MALIDNIDELRELHSMMTPELVRFMELARETGPVIPIKADKLVFLGEAAEVLGTNKTVVCRYIKDGLLKPVYTPYCSKRKFWLSEVKALATAKEVKA